MKKVTNFLAVKYTMAIVFLLSFSTVTYSENSDNLVKAGKQVQGIFDTGTGALGSIAVFLGLIAWLVFGVSFIWQNQSVQRNRLAIFCVGAFLIAVGTGAMWSVVQGDFLGGADAVKPYKGATIES